jgi:hypothetical protein
LASANSLAMKREIILKMIPLALVTLFFIQIAPVDQFSIISNVDFVHAWSGVLLLFVGLIFLIEYFKNKPDAGHSKKAKSGAYMFLGISVITRIYGGATLFGFFDPMANAGNSEILNLGLTIILGISALLLYASVHPTIITHKHITLAKHLR